jgi:GH24 family phage-related lysozyme (muramidase)
MKPGVLLALGKLTRKFEGVIPHFYLDIKGLVTIGYGCLMEPEFRAATLPMYTPGGIPATPSEVVQDWRRVKLARHLAAQGWKAAAKVAQLRMTDLSMERLMEDRATTLEHHLRKAYPQWDSLPPEAQLAILLMGWAIGSDLAKKFPRFTNAVNGGNWHEAVRQCKIKGEETNRGLKPRNEAIRNLLSELAEG